MDLNQPRYDSEPANDGSYVAARTPTPNGASRSGTPPTSPAGAASGSPESTFREPFADHRGETSRPPIFHPEHRPALEGPVGACNGRASDWERLLEVRLHSPCPDNLYVEIRTTMERQLMRLVLDHADGNLDHASRVLGIPRARLMAKLRTLGISA
jgi:hypothetical protein